MEGGGSSYDSQGGLELEALQKQHEEKTEKIQRLKKDIESAKVRLEKQKKKVPEEQLQALKTLTDKYNCLRDEYNNALLAQRSTSNYNNKAK